MRVALCQIPVGDDPKENLQRVREALDAAPDADLAVFPEATQLRFGRHLAELAEPLDGPWVTGLAEAAREHGTAVIAGMFEPAPANRVHNANRGHSADKVHNGGRVYNTAVAVDGSGELVGSYRKVHLFDAFDDRESDLVAPGTEPVVVRLAGLNIGLITCYDIRFPELARALVDRGADILVVIAAWVQGPFKEEHWTTLVRARAIENTSWVVAVGKAPERKVSDGVYGTGRSLLVDPMGAVQADLGLFPGVRVVDLDPAMTDRVRRILPALSHRRPDLFR